MYYRHGSTGSTTSKHTGSGLFRLLEEGQQLLHLPRIHETLIDLLDAVEEGEERPALLRPVSHGVVETGLRGVEALRHHLGHLDRVLDVRVPDRVVPLLLVLLTVVPAPLGDLLPAPGSLLEDRGVEVTGLDAAHTNLELLQLDCELLGVGDHAELGDGVRTEERTGDEAVEGGDVDHPSLIVPELLEERPDHPVQRDQVDVKSPHVLLICHLDQRA